MWPTVPTHLYTYLCGKEARDCTQFRLQKEYGHTDGRRHASGAVVQSVGRVVLDKLARFKSNLSRKGRESLWTATEGGGQQLEGYSTSCFALLAGARAPNIWGVKY